MANKYPSVGSTMTPTHSTAPKFIGEHVDTNQFTLNSVSVDGITHSIDTSDPSKLLTAFGGKYLYEELAKDIDDIKNKVNELRLTPVLSEPLLPIGFIGNDWDINGWYLDNGKAIYLNRNGINNNNSIKIKTEAFVSKGDYFLYFNINTITNGRLIIKNEKGEIIKSASTPEQYSLAFSIEEPSLAYLELIAQDVSANGSIILDFCSVHHVKSAFEVYVEYLVEQLSSGNSGLVTEAQLNQAILEAIQKSQTYTNTVTSNITSDIDDHIKDTNNPHSVTYTQIGAAAKNHTHSNYTTQADVKSQIDSAIATSESGILGNLNSHIQNKSNPHAVTYTQIGAAAKVHKHELSDVGPNGAADALHTHTPASIGAADINHTHTPISIGAADRNHTHTLDELGAAAKDHTHSQYIDRDEATDVINDLIGDVREDVANDLNTHIQDTNNPHKVNYIQVGAAAANHTHTPESIGAADRDHTHTASDIEGLDESILIVTNLENNVTDLNNTILEHISNNNNPHNVTKEDLGLDDIVNGGMATTQEAIDGQLDTKYMNPSNTKDVFDYYGNTLNPILAQTLTPRLIANSDAINETIDIALQSEHIYQIYINFYYVSDNCTIHFGDNYNYASTCIESKYDGSGTTYSSDTSVIIALPTDTFSRCKLEINSSLGTILGKQIVLEDSKINSIDINGLIYKSDLSGDILDDITTISLSINGSCNIRVYELVATNQDPAMVVDALPKGNIVSRYGKTVIPGYTILDGSELSIVQHQDLFDYAQSANLFVERDIYNEEVLAQGYTEHFGYDTGDTTFLIPKDGVSTNGLYRYMKIDDVYVPETKQVLYRYIWNE